MSTFCSIVNVTNRVVSLAAFVLGAVVAFSGEYAQAAYLVSLAAFGMVVAGPIDD